MTTALTTRNGANADAWGIMERVIIVGDLAKLEAQERVLYYRQVCESVGLNPLTRPFDYITLNNKLTLYARKEATDQLREINGVSIFKIEEQTLDGVHRVRAYARVPDGREDTALGAVTVDNLRGEALANALMKAETKAKRRVTLSICGLGWLDETEVETIPTARPITVSVETGEITSAPPAQAPQRTEKPPAVAGVQSPASSAPAASQASTAPPVGDPLTLAKAKTLLLVEPFGWDDRHLTEIMETAITPGIRIGQAGLTEWRALYAYVQKHGRDALAGELFPEPVAVSAV